MGPLLGRVYHRSRADLWASTPRELDMILEDWADMQKRG